ncbi:hypothetical protein GCM10018777_07430 [Streptomyces albogriseolus]|nr:hypothetical protein GCM10018777_07430 [Streptomyces viridodiastaticus]
MLLLGGCGRARGSGTELRIYITVEITGQGMGPYVTCAGSRARTWRTAGRAAGVYTMSARETHGGRRETERGRAAAASPAAGAG